MELKKFKNIKISNQEEKNKVKLTKEQRLLAKEEKRAKKEELKELKQENKKVLVSTKELVPFLDVDKDDSLITKDGYLDIFQVESKDIYSFNEYETQLNIYSFVSFLRGYSDDFKLISMNFPVNTVRQQEYIRKKLDATSNKIYSKCLKEKLEQLVFLEENRNNREFYIIIFAKEKKEYLSNLNTLLRNQNVAVKLRKVDVEKKLKILFKLNNPNTKLM